MHIEALNVVVHGKDGNIVKGTTYNFSPRSGSFHLFPLEAPAGGVPLVIELDQLKAVFVVRDFAGDPDHKDANEFQPDQSIPGQRMELVFQDGEKLMVVSPGYSPTALGFWVYPADTGSNNLRAFVINSSLREVRSLANA